VIDAGRRQVLSALSQELWEAERVARPIDPLTDRRDDLGVTDAYAIQDHNIERRVSAGRTVRGRTVGLTQRVMRDRLLPGEPYFGVLVDDMFVDDGDEVPLAGMIQPRVEAALAFVMARDLAGPGVTTADALAAIGGVLPAIEVLDSRIADWRIRLVDTVADNASSARVVVGGRLTPVTHVDLRLVGVLLHRNGMVIDSGAGAAALGNPARCVAWLANSLVDFGTAVQRGDIVLSGALHRRVPMRPGDVFQAEFGHIGAATVRFAERGEPA
jgi:2-keto-4-pentenoate hydratase